MDDLEKVSFISTLFVFILYVDTLYTQYSIPTELLCKLPIILNIVINKEWYYTHTKSQVRQTNQKNY